MVDLHSTIHSFKKEFFSAFIFLQIFPFIWIKFSMLPQPVDLLKLVLNLSFMTNTYMRVPYPDDFAKDAFHIGLRWDAY